MIKAELDLYEKDPFHLRNLSHLKIGTPYCITYDFDSLEDNCVTVRDRDTMEQERVKIEDLVDYFRDKLFF